MKKFIIIIGIVVIVIIGIISAVLLSQPTNNAKKSTNNPATTYTSIDFYSADLPITTRQAIKSWLDTNSGVTGLNNSTVTVRKGSYLKNFDSTNSVFTYSFLVDLTGTPHVTYKVQAGRSTNNGPSSLYMTCPAVIDQLGTPSDCKGQTQL